MSPPIEIFRRGRQVASDGSALDFADADLAAAAAAYDPALHQAPLVIGHPRDADLAYGWIAALAYREADGTLLGTAAQVDPNFAELHRAGRLKYHSASFYRPEAPTNPKPGTWYLRHLGFLGAQPPAVKGLKPAQFDEADTADTLTLTFAEPGSEDPDMSEKTAEFAERERQIAEAIAALAAREAAIAEREQAARAQVEALRRAECTQFAERLVAEGRLLPADRDTVAAVLARLGADAEPHADFADPGDNTKAPRPPAAALRDLLARLPVQVDFSERSAPTGSAPIHADFSAPRDFEVDPVGLALHRKAVAYQAAHPQTDYLAAVRAVGG